MPCVACAARCLLLVASSCATPYRRESLGSVTSMHDWNQKLLRPLREEIGSRHVRIIWIGDSTTRNLIHFICDILTGNASDTCNDQAGVFTIVKGAEFGGNSPPWRMDTAVMDRFHAIHDSKNVRGSSTSVDVVYFGSTLLHAMQLLPIRSWRGDGIDTSMTRGLENVVMQIRAARMCPVFHTINWICDRQFNSDYGAVVKNATMLRSAYFETMCAKAVHSSSATDVALCANLSLTSWGSDYGASLELAAIDAIGPPLNAIDMHAMTKHQCWAAGDGRHYSPLLPQKAALLFQAVSKCAISDNSGV